MANQQIAPAIADRITDTKKANSQLSDPNHHDRMNTQQTAIVVMRALFLIFSSMVLASVMPAPSVLSSTVDNLFDRLHEMG